MNHRLVPIHPRSSLQILITWVLALALTLAVGLRTALAVPTVAQSDTVVDVHGLGGVRASLLKTARTLVTIGAL